MSDDALNSELQDAQIFRIDDLPEPSQVVQKSPRPSKTKRQAQIVQQPGSKLMGFSANVKQRTTIQAAKVSPMAKRKKVSPPISLMSSDEEEDECNENEMKEFQQIMETPMLQVFDDVAEKTQKNLLEWVQFQNFSEALFEEQGAPTGHYPNTVLLFLCFFAVHYRMPSDELFNEEREQMIDQLFTVLPPRSETKTWNTKILDMAKRIMTRRENLSAGPNLAECAQVMMQTLKELESGPLLFMPLACLPNIWENMDASYQTFVSLAHLKTLFAYFKSLKLSTPNAIPQSAAGGNWSANMATTSTSSMSAPIQTQLVAVRGSREAASGDVPENFDLDDEFMSLTSRFGSGKTSLDITLQTATQSKTLKAEVLMDDLVYELKIYK